MSGVQIPANVPSVVPACIQGPGRGIAVAKALEFNYFAPCNTIGIFKVRNNLIPRVLSYHPAHENLTVRNTYNKRGSSFLGLQFFVYAFRGYEL